jgi:N-methylhydantoinase B/oxoprolinase/acetone carboxylase alpha subunit
LGDPKGRDKSKIAADVLNGLVSPDTARSIYGAKV